jgi:hypothetical protein
MDSRTLFHRYLLLLCVALLAVSFLVPRYYNIPYPKPLGPQTDFTPNVQRGSFKVIASEQPEITLIGDSVLYTGVEPEYLSKDLGVKTYMIAVPGIGSAVWYLIFKNVVLEARHRPKYIVIPFRDTQLTIPDFHTTGHYFSLVDEYATEREPLLVDLAYTGMMNPADKLADQYFPLYSARWSMREGLNNRLRYSAPMLLGCGETCTNDALNAAMNKAAADNIISSVQGAYDVNVLYARSVLDFDHQVDRSFLPVIIDLARKNDITVIFVRMKNLDFPTSAYETPALTRYIQSLEEYLSRQDQVRYLDLSHDERILSSYFVADGAHFTEEGKLAFTKILAGELKKIIDLP